MILLLRHCDKTAEAADAPLSAKGFEQAQGIVATLTQFGIKRILSSPYLRAQQSVAPFAAAAGLAIEPVEALSEWRLAGGPRDDWKAVLRRGFASPNTKATGGESAADVWARAQTVLHMSEPTLLVTHGGWLSVVLGHFGRAATLENLLALRSPDLFSLNPEGCHHHEL